MKHVKKDKVLPQLDSFKSLLVQITHEVGRKANHYAKAEGRTENDHVGLVIDQFAFFRFSLYCPELASAHGVASRMSAGYQ